MAIESNKYVYPSVSFADLSVKSETSVFGEPIVVSVGDVGVVLRDTSEIDIRIFGQSVEEKILSLFLSDDVLFGPKEYIETYREEWLRKLRYFTGKAEPIRFTLLGFPFKIPVPLKTDRTLADMGEALALFRVYSIMEKIVRIYAPGARVNIFTEGAFNKPADVPFSERIAYRDSLRRLNDDLGFSPVIAISDLSDMEKNVENFSLLLSDKIADFRELYERRDPEYMKKYNGSQEAVFRIVSTKMYDRELLMDAYNEDLSDDTVSDEVLKIRSDIRNRTHEAILYYHAYLKVRDDINYLEKSVPHGLALSVSPKPGRLGIIPVHKDCVRLPYHAVPIYLPSEKKFSLEYLTDIVRSGKKYIPVHLQNDTDPKPFYYVLSETS